MVKERGKKMSKKSKFAVGAAIGAIVGVAAGILTAPKSGKETRDDIKKKTDEAKVEVDKRAKEAKNEAPHLPVPRSHLLDCPISSR